MKIKLPLILLVFLISSSVIANDVPVNDWLGSGSLQVHEPWFIKGPNVKTEEFGPRHILSNTYQDLATLVPVQGEPFFWDNKKEQNWTLRKIPDGEIMEINPSRKAEYQIAYHAFYIESGGLNTYQMEVESPQMFEVFLQGKKIGSNYKAARDSDSL
jgi:hypothetical protein